MYWRLFTEYCELKVEEYFNFRIKINIICTCHMLLFMSKERDSE